MTGKNCHRNSKVFLIGFNKCGTRSFHDLFVRSGYDGVHWAKGRLALDIDESWSTGMTPLQGFADDAVVFSDMECVHLGSDNFVEGYKYFAFLDEKFPDSRFILNTRDVDKWLASRMAHARGRYARYYMDHLGLEDRSDLEAYWRNDWHLHHRQVLDHFGGPGGKLMTYDIERDTPEKIAEFLSDRFDISPTNWRKIGARAKKH